MRRPLLGLVLLLGALALAPYPSTPAVASCAGPSLDLPQDTALDRGTTITVAGSAFVDGCQDSMSCSGAPGCQSCEWDSPEPVPTVDVALVLRQHGRSWPLGTVDADDDGRATWTFTLPDGVRPGRARLLAGDLADAAIRVR